MSNLKVIKSFDKHGPFIGSKWLASPSPSAVPAQVEKLGSYNLPWHIAVSSDASLIAILGETVLEVWSSRENYNQLVGRRGVRFLNLVYVPIGKMINRL